ncbi:MAG: PAS domain-containing sensor histidine kinase [Gemmatimonadota bacterium]
MPQRTGDLPRRSPEGRRRVGRPESIRSRLLFLLLAFGVLPLLAAIGFGYPISRAIITSQAEQALEELGRRQVVHLSTELARERLLLRTITGQLPVDPGPDALASPDLAKLLAQSLPEDGVFDGLRIVRADGGIVESVALGHSTPHWPAAAPAGDWVRHSVIVHREGSRVLAYLLAVPLRGPSADAWLEGHVRAEDFARLLSLPSHLMGDVESAIVERGGGPVLFSHEHASRDLTSIAADLEAAGHTRGRVTVDGAPSIAMVLPVADTDWIFVTTLPTEVALAPLARLRANALVILALFVVLIIVTGVIAARSVTTPLHELAEAALDYGRAGVYRPVAKRGNDEIARLIEAFGRMANDLSESRDEIERLHTREMARAQQLATVGELASGVAHEIRNPLTGVKGALELAVRRLPPGDGHRPLLDEANQQLGRIDATIKQLLRYARPPELKELPLDARLLVERAVRVVQTNATARQMEIRVEAAERPVPVEADPELMVQVLVNLMLNGIDAMDSGGTLTVRVAPEGTEARIEVSDTGPGIAPERRSEVFRPFFSTKSEGTGLGLPISEQIVSRHGGSLRLEDREGGGATFVILLPLTESEGASHG